MTLKKVNLITTSIFTILYVLATVGLAVIAPLSVMAFDQPGSVNMWQPWTFVILMISWPIAFLLSIILSWLLYVLKIYQGSLVMLLLPLINLVGLFILFCVMSLAP